jgi:hypothetical protein
MIETTANQLFNYFDYYDNKTLDQWIQDIHSFDALINGWSNIPLKRGSFGYDFIGHSFVNSFDFLRSFKEKDKMIKSELIDIVAGKVHEGWVANYIFWRDEKPYLKNNFYKKPAKPLGDEHREMLSILNYEDLDDDDKEGYKIIAEYIVNNLMKRNI